MNLKSMMLSERDQAQRLRISIGFHLHKILKKENCNDSKAVAAGGQIKKGLLKSTKKCFK